MEERERGQTPKTGLVVYSWYAFSKQKIARLFKHSECFKCKRIIAALRGEILIVHVIPNRGKNASGQLGTGRPTSERLPVEIAALNNLKVSSVACGPEFSAAVTGREMINA